MSESDLTVLALRGMAQSHAADFNLDYSESSLASVNAMLITLMNDPLSAQAREWAKLYDANGHGWAEHELKEKGRNTQMIKIQNNIVKGAFFYLMEVCAREFGGKWTVKSSWLSGKKIGLEFSGRAGRFLDVSTFLPADIQSKVLAGSPNAIPRHKLPTEVYASVAKSLGRG